VDNAAERAALAGGTIAEHGGVAHLYHVRRIH
jgi:hypothetical protein